MLRVLKDVIVEMYGGVVVFLRSRQTHCTATSIDFSKLFFFPFSCPHGTALF